MAPVERNKFGGYDFSTTMWDIQEDLIISTRFHTSGLSCMQLHYVIGLCELTTDSKELEN